MVPGLYADEDITEIFGFDNLHRPEGIIKDIEEKARLHQPPFPAARPLLSGMPKARLYPSTERRRRYLLRLWQQLQEAGY